MGKHKPREDAPLNDQHRSFAHKPSDSSFHKCPLHHPCPPHDPCHDPCPHEPCHDPCPPHDPCDAYVCCDCCDIQPITSCLKKLKDVTRCVFECLEMHPSHFRELQVAFCIVLTELSVINDKLDCISKVLCELADPCRGEKKPESTPASGGDSGRGEA